MISRQLRVEREAHAALEDTRGVVQRTVQVEREWRENLLIKRRCHLAFRRELCLENGLSEVGLEPEFCDRVRKTGDLWVPHEVTRGQRSARSLNRGNVLVVRRLDRSVHGAYSPSGHPVLLSPPGGKADHRCNRRHPRLRHIRRLRHELRADGHALPPFSQVVRDVNCRLLHWLFHEHEAGAPPVSRVLDVALRIHPRFALCLANEDKLERVCGSKDELGHLTAVGCNLPLADHRLIHPSLPVVLGPDIDRRKGVVVGFVTFRGEREGVGNLERVAQPSVVDETASLPKRLADGEHPVFFSMKVVPTPRIWQFGRPLRCRRVWARWPGTATLSWWWKRHNLQLESNAECTLRARVCRERAEQSAPPRV
eukprot:m.435675 g.435675  ORF g.435675 m.435675 type:complete len:368 (+) comp17877_c0_seq1:1917-3020(+)